MEIYLRKAKGGLMPKKTVGVGEKKYIKILQRLLKELDGEVADAVEVGIKALEREEKNERF